MKKILFALFIGVCMFPSVGFADDNVGKIYKIESYKYSELTDSFELEQYGSAVYMEDNLIYTNAHVVLDEDDVPFGLYRVCKTYDFKKVPQCFTVGRLLYYDTQNDLAALKIGTPGNDAVTLSSVELDVGDTVKVYGYPGIGGNTITYTEGKISGYENGLYKIDANIDSGNSGGGVFDSQGNLIGIAVSVKINYSTLGYIIPLTKIKDFKKKIGGNIIENKEKINSKFFAYNYHIKKILSKNDFSNTFLNIDKVKKYGFSMSIYHVDNARKKFMSLLQSNDSQTEILLTNSIVLGSRELDMNELYNSNKKTYKEGQDK